MDDGLIQLLFIGFLVIVSMMDGAARKRRREAEQLGQPPEPDWSPEPEWIPEEDHGEADVTESSETLVPQDLWKDIAALARGEVPGSMGGPATPSSTREPDAENEGWDAPGEGLSETPARGTLGERDPAGARGMARWDAPAPVSEGGGDLQGGYLHPEQAVTHEEHAQILPLDRPLPPEAPHEFVPHSLAPVSGEGERSSPTQQAPSVLEGVRSGSRSSLRDAIVLAEVLNLPLALRDSDPGPPGRE
jgi:hypothetical protein